MFKLRDYQEEGTQACVEILTSKKRCRELVIAPTAAGKSIYTAETVKRVNKPIVIIQPNRELLLQNYEKYLAVGGKATICCASLKTKTVKGVDYTELEDGTLVKCREVSETTFATVGSVIKHIDELKKLNVELLLLDEAHLLTQSTKTLNKQGKKVEKPAQIKKLVKEVGIKNICGLTATSFYLKAGFQGARLVMMNRAQWKLFTDIRHITQISYLVEKGYWSKLNYKVFETDSKILKKNSSGSDFTVESLKEYYRSNNLEDQIIEEIGNLKKQGRKSIMVFVNTIDEADRLYKKIPNSAIVHSKIDLKTRALFIKEFKALEIPVILNVNCLSTGFDHPLVDAIITARPTQSIGLFYQQIGRGVRIHPDKEDCKIIDFSGNVKRFGKVEGLKYCNVQYYGWGLFSDDNKLLTDYPIAARNRPTIKSLIENGGRTKKAEKKKVIKTVQDNPNITFGMWKGRKVLDIYNNGKDRKRFLSWCEWFMKEQKKPSPYPKNKTMIDAIEKVLIRDAKEFNKSNLHY